MSVARASRVLLDRRYTYSTISREILRMGVTVNFPVIPGYTPGSLSKPEKLYAVFSYAKPHSHGGTAFTRFISYTFFYSPIFSFFHFFTARI